MLIDMDDTILSAYGRPEIAWNIVAEEFAGELGAAPPQQVAAAMVDSGRKFWATAEPAWRLKLDEARHVVVRADLRRSPPQATRRLSLDLATRLADRFTPIAKRQMFVFPGAHDAIDALQGARREAGAGHQRRRRTPARQGRALCAGASLRSHPDRGRARFRQAGRARLSARRWRRSASPRPRPG